MTLFLLGAIAAGSLVAALFFMRLWRDSRDPLFLYFSAAFAIEGVNRTALAMQDVPSEGQAVFYVVRLLAYLLIVAGIAHKNLRPR
jgi:uncharacterized membrane protein HdeD (DUF308 family)